MTPTLLNSPLFTGSTEILKEAGSGDYPQLILRGKLQEALMGNNNGRKYKVETLQQKIIDARCSMQQLKEDPLFGESIHPEDKLTGEINPEKIIWKLKEAHMEGTTMMGSLEIIPETPIGRILYFLVERYQARPGISSRGFGAMDGDWVDHDSYKFVTFDGTFNPSTHGAFLSKIGESSELNEMIKSFSEKDLQVISENSILRADGKSLVESAFKTKYHIINKKEDMSNELELIKESNAQIQGLTTQLTESNLALKSETQKLAEAIEENKRLKAALKESEDEKEAAEKKAADAEEEMEEKKKAMKEMEDEKEEEEEEKEKLEENYNKALEVTEGVVAEYHKMKGYYDKSIEVLNLMESQKTETTVKELVESELGEYGKFETFFNGVTDIEKAQAIVESVKSIQGSTTPAGPAQNVPLVERTEAGNSKSVSDDEARINAYDI